MHPELFKIPFTEITLKSYGLMMVIGFLSAVWLIRRLSKNITPDPQMITNAALYSLIAGVVGARLFYILHYFNQFKDNPLSVFAIWDGGIELLGGVLLAILVIALYLRHHKLPARQYLDILAIALMLALMFGRIGCFLSGCCFGKPSNVPWAIHFPYGSTPYQKQIEPDTKRNRNQAYINLPDDFYNLIEENGITYMSLKPYDELTNEQKALVDNGSCSPLGIHPTQLYSSSLAAVNCMILFIFWKRSQKAQKQKLNKFLTKPGSTFALMFILYAIVRFFIEFLRDDNPYEKGWWAIYKSGTISQNICIYLFIFGIALMIFFQKLKFQPQKHKSK